MAEKRIQPGGYICKQRLDDIGAYNAEILRDLEAMIGANVSKEEMYRLVAKVMHRIHLSNKAITELKLIYE
jgi:hypothetical protein